jgi:hypothetical protein
VSGTQNRYSFSSCQNEHLYITHGGAHEGPKQWSIASLHNIAEAARNKIKNKRLCVHTLPLGTRCPGHKTVTFFSPQCNYHVKTSISTPHKTPMKVQEDSKAMVSSYSAAHARDRTVGPSRENTQVHGVQDTKPLHFFVMVQLSCQTEHLYPT